MVQGRRVSHLPLCLGAGLYDVLLNLGFVSGSTDPHLGPRRYEGVSGKPPNDRSHSRAGLDISCRVGTVEARAGDRRETGVVEEPRRPARPAVERGGSRTTEHKQDSRRRRNFVLITVVFVVVGLLAVGEAGPFAIEIIG